MLRNIAFCLFCLVICAAFTSCTLFDEELRGKPVAAEYHGLAGKSVAIVVYAAPATTDEFPTAREDISIFLATQMRLKMPDVRVLNYKEVIRWQDDTINWFGLTEKEIGKHFSVDRVLYVELIDYSSRMAGGYGDLQGHVGANCRVFECETAGNEAAWTSLFEICWPESRPLDANQTSELAVRKRTVEIFADQITDKLYDHKYYRKPLSERD